MKSSSLRAASSSIRSLFGGKFLRKDRSKRKNVGRKRVHLRGATVRSIDLLFARFLAEREKGREDENDLDQTESQLSTTENEVQRQDEPLPNRPIEISDNGDQRQKKPNDRHEHLFSQIGIDNQF